MAEAIETIIVGGGQAGLAMSYWFRQASREHLILERGRIVERGTHAELLERSGLYARLYEQQFRSGLVEAVTRDGVILSSGEVVRTSSG